MVHIPFVLGVGAVTFALTYGIRKEERQAREEARTMGCRCGKAKFQEGPGGKTLG